MGYLERYPDTVYEAKADEGGEGRGGSLYAVCCDLKATTCDEGSYWICSEHEVKGTIAG